MSYTTTDGGPFSYVAWLPQDYGDRPYWGARLIIYYNYGYSTPHQIVWVGDRQTIGGPEHLRKDFWAKVQPLVQGAFEKINLPESAHMIETQDDWDFKIATKDSVQGVAVYYHCAHGYCYLVAVETD